MEKQEFFSYTWHQDEEEDEVTVIRGYGLRQDKDGKQVSVCVRVNDFTPYIYLELPNDCDWNETRAQVLGNKIDELMGKQKPLTKRFAYKKKMYFANVEKNGKRKLFPYLMCAFSSTKDIRTLSYKIRRTIFVAGVGAVKLKMHEQPATPILQLTCCRKITPAGWVNFVGRPVANEDKVSLCDEEYIVRYKNLAPIERDTIPTPKILGFDIEVNSSIITSFPKATRPGDKVFQIGIAITDGKTERKMILSLFDPDPEKTGSDIEIIKYKTEADLLVGFTDIVRKERPNVVAGYNILGFDIPFMIQRAKQEMCIFDFDKIGLTRYTHAREKTIVWNSSAYKNQSFQFLDSEGILYLDLLPLVKRDYKFDNYKLKTISTHFLGETKDPLSVKGIFKCYRLGKQGGKRGSKAMGIVAKYCTQDAVLVNRLIARMDTWTGLCEKAKTCMVIPFHLYTKGQQVTVFSQLYKYCMFNNFVVENEGYVTKDNERYVGAHVFPPVPGVYDMVEPFDFASLYPNTIIAYNIDYSTLVPPEDNDKVPDELCNVMSWEDHIGCEHDPNVIRKNVLTEKIDFVKKDIEKLRKKRDATKFKYEKQTCKDEIAKLEKAMKPWVRERSELQKKKPKYIMCDKRYFKFMKEPKGIMPTVLVNLLTARKNTRAVIKVLKKELESGKCSKERVAEIKAIIAVLDKRQLSYKVSANSMYGAMGVRKGYLPFMPGAMATTYMGRQNIELVAKTITTKYRGELIYGDTDSAYIHFPHIKTAQEAWDYSVMVADEVTALFPPPMKLEFEEDIYWRFLILTKKRYMYRACKRDGVVDNKIGKKGVLLARRDNSLFIRTVYEEVIAMIFDKKSRDEVVYYILTEVNKLCCGYYTTDYFVVTKAVGDTGDLTAQPFVDEKGKLKGMVGDYKVDLLPEDRKKRDEAFAKKEVTSEKDYYLSCMPGQVQLAEKMRRRGQRVEPGSRLEYLVTTTGGHAAKQSVKIENIDYFKAHSTVLKVDYMYYLKMLATPLDQVLNILYFRDDNDEFPEDFLMKNYKFRLNVREKMLNQLRSYSKPTLVFDK